MTTLCANFVKVHANRLAIYFFVYSILNIGNMYGVGVLVRLEQ